MKKEKQIKDKRYSIKKWKTGGVIAALTASVAVFVVMVQMEKSILTKYEKGTVFTAAVEIPQGQLITEGNYLQYFKERQLDKSCIPQTALCTPEQVLGLVAVIDIEQGVVLTDGMFRKLDLILAEMETPVVAGFKADDIYQLAGGVLRSGDRVNIYAVREEETCLVWRNVFVQQVFDASGSAISNADAVTAAQRVNVYLNEADVEDFYTELAGGSLRVVKLLK